LNTSKQLLSVFSNFSMFHVTTTVTLTLTITATLTTLT